MANKIEMYRPGFVDDDGKEYEFETTIDLLSIEDVNRFSEIPNFHRFSISRRGEKFILMAEYKDGFEWWVVGYMSQRVDLPEWKAKEREEW